ncbi:MAG: LamB/YcsF family protein, partial [Alicyclobacillus sp.]|nr:LamB/YcsF family protein [Alicyclobacillus sp.]
MHIDLNSDVGESFGPFTVGSDEQVIPLVSSVNIACGFHAGDPRVMHETVRRAKAAGVAIGAHPGLMDLYGFGRRKIPVTPDEVYDLVLYQLGALDAFVRAESLELRHVKPHGALYNMAAADPHLAQAIAAAVASYNPRLILFALAGSELVRAARSAGLQVAQEAFVDRRYDAEGRLVERGHPDALIGDPMEAAERVVRMVKHGKVTAVDGTELNVEIDTVCVHGDNPRALQFAAAVRDELKRNGIELRPPAPAG